MSFLNNTRPDRTPGPINNTNGVCEKVCIQATKIFDECIKQEQLEPVSITLTDITPSTPTPVQPFTYVSSKSSSNIGEVSNLTITPIADGCGYRVKADVTFRMEVIFRDNNGVLFRGYGDILINRDVKLNVPKPSLIPFDVIARINAVAPEGNYVSGFTFTISCCITTILQIVMEVQLLLPCYGYAYIPPSIDFREEVCDAFFDLPLYPTDSTYCKR